ncbi:hypothetical protein [Alcanivorax quisquiliarum]|uniref:Uncharacterized protein n=1 Tax=Alcanivorax quisquiliarum TaxID=2933565 RepID=A0ABT0E4W6_9GAMM|nr:hypothetical protein [Alcanivorax quisquiliarum]MCK0536835.1 hypothetical protein [Alcanivorax quisquiliarum]
MRGIVLKLTFLLVYWSLVGCGQELPKDRYLQYLLEDKRESYLAVVDKVLEENIYRLEVTSNKEFYVEPAAINADSVVDMRELIEDRLGLDLINTIFADGAFGVINEVSFFNYRKGFVFSGEHKGIAYIVDESGIEAVAQLDKIDKSDTSIHGKRLYKFLEPHWYIFYEYFP